ncbi:hypothetical protein KH5H1_68270 [Corallococcus caeni]|uniref:AraC family transcriptional regulator n=1 Tax=Corallococcus caeni TaxID=3082388 RepID=A0ABQ6R346_9BACT|nr:hypothetical protein KH5H1_68270 [Corallococcus sp. KH5-1]GMU10743.1 hypothetical protein ASNO1_69970 [Corallococcus sp. NO1]
MGRRYSVMPSTLATGDREAGFEGARAAEEAAGLGRGAGAAHTGGAATSRTASRASGVRRVMRSSGAKEWARDF